MNNRQLVSRLLKAISESSIYYIQLIIFLVVQNTVHVFSAGDSICQVHEFTHFIGVFFYCLIHCAVSNRSHYILLLSLLF